MVKGPNKSRTNQHTTSQAAEAEGEGGGEGAGQQIRSKAQYDNWLQLQAMKKATGGAANVRPQSNNNITAGSKAGG